MSETFFVTTPIYYVNDEPHLGHAYTTILADVLAGYHRLQSQLVFFVTGVDEHGQKVYNAVRRAADNEPRSDELRAYVDAMASRFQAVWAHLNIRYDDFIRTTQERHVRVVQAVLQDLWQRGEIYRGEYTGWYCVPDERFWTEKDLKRGEDGTALCPECGRALEQITEANYFFKMSQYQDWLVNHIQSHPEFIQPEHRRNEVLGFLRQPLSDLCISRPANRINWGIPLPFDPAFVTYVWFDALLNYVTAAGYLQDNAPTMAAPIMAAPGKAAPGKAAPDKAAPGKAAPFETLFPNAVHLIGKDILTTHAVYWPTMLKAAGLPQPKTIFAHGWWVLEDGVKMGKSLGNAVRPLDLAGVYGVDAFRYFLIRDMTLGQDAAFDEARLAGRYASDLANTLGNLLHRVTHLLARSCGGRIPELAAIPAPGWDHEAGQAGAGGSGEPGSEDASPYLSEVLAEARAQRAQAEQLPEQVFGLVQDFRINQAVGDVMDLLAAANGFLERTAPWKLAKAGRAEDVALVLYTAAEVLRIAGVLLSPVLPERSAELFRRLGWSAPGPLGESLAWGGLAAGAAVVVGEPLFPREKRS